MGIWNVVVVVVVVPLGEESNVLISLVLQLTYLEVGVVGNDYHHQALVVVILPSKGNIYVICMVERVIYPVSRMTSWLNVCMQERVDA